MVIVSSQSSPVRTQVATPSLQTGPLASESAVAHGTDSSLSACFSSLARKLSAAALRAQARDAALDPKALGQKAGEVLSELSVASDGVESRPFKGMPRDQLALITYDEGGEFTGVERASARQEAAEQEQHWRQSATTRALSEYNATGNMTGFFSEALTHFRSLPLIDQVQYPAVYEADLQHKAGRTGSQPFNSEEEIKKVLPETAYTKPITAETNLYATKNNTAAALGRELLVSRLFDGREPRVVSGEHGMSMENIYRSPYEFLTREDRELFAEIYHSYAQDQNADLGYVDEIAFRLGDYRQHNDGRIMGNFNMGSYDSQGRQLTVSYNERDTAAAARILYGSAISSTRLDQGFLRYTLDPGFDGVCHRSDLRFLEHMVTRFSASAGAVPKLDECFASFPTGHRPINSIMTAASEVTRPPRPCDSSGGDDVASHLTKERTPVAELTSLDLDSLIGKPGELFMMLQNMKTRMGTSNNRPAEIQGVEGQLPPGRLVSKPRIK